MASRLQLLVEHQARLRACRRCPDVLGPVVVGEPAVSPVIQVGQAPGAREGEFGRPFAWTAGKTLFGWYQRIGVAEADFRQRVYMAAVCRCFPGKNPRGGDRLPSDDEVGNCAAWLAAEMDLLRPALVIPVGKLAMQQFLAFARLTDVVGELHRVSLHGRAVDVVPLPHPSGASTWHRVEPGKALLQDALTLIADHPAWRRLFDRPVR
ncbi:MAG: uracil-DNA glycosylase family protein [Gammaproteobacteria bacterium]|nr:uracil-DNA glycosylase family protein [Gammaproteobacteria bacterium]